MKRYPIVWEDGKKYLVIHGSKVRTGYIPARERRELANKFNLPPLTVMGPKPRAAAAVTPASPTTAVHPASEEG